MKHTLDELLDIVYRYYPRGVGMVDGDLDTSVIEKSEEHARLVAARRKAATDERWHALLRRIKERFPDAPLMNDSIHLPTGNYDACYSFIVYLPGESHDRALSFQVSFLAPYYIIPRSGTVGIAKTPRTDSFRVDFQGIQFRVSRSPLDPELISDVDGQKLKPVTIECRHVTFDLLPEQRPYAEWIAREIEATFGCEPMPPEVGTVIVPDLATPRLPGETRLYDCLFTKDEWVKPSPVDVPAPGVRVDPNQLTAPFIAVLTVLAALYHIAWALFPREPQMGYYWAIRTDGILHKAEMLEVLTKLRLHVESPVTLRAMAAAREFEALVTAWDGDGAPPEAMVAWASGFLAEWDVGRE